MTGHKRARRDGQDDEEEHKSGTSNTTHHTPPPSSQPQHPSLPSKPHFVTPLSPRKNHQRIIHHHHTLPQRPSISVQVAAVKSHPLPLRPAVPPTPIQTPIKMDISTFLPATPPATPAPSANGDTIGKISDIPTLLMILRTKEQLKPALQIEERPLKAVYPQINNVDS